MPLDAFFLTALIPELKEALVGGKIDKIYQPHRHVLMLNIYSAGTNHHLLISARTGFVRVHLTRTRPANPAVPPMFCMLLRRYLEGGRINSIQQVPWERIVEMEIVAPDQLGNPAAYKLMVELTGKHSNIILLDEQGRILDAIKRIGPGQSRVRTIIPGKVYELPPMPQNLDPSRVEPAELAAHTDSSVEDVLLSSIKGIGPLVAKEAAYSAEITPDKPVETLNHNQWQKLISRIQTLASQAVNRANIKPLLYLDQDMEEYPASTRDFYYTELSIYKDLPARTTQTLNELVDEYYTAKEVLESISIERNSLLGVVRAHLKRLSNVIQLRQQALAESSNATAFKLQGELLLANLHRIPAKAEKVELENYYDPDGSPVTIFLDPTKSPKENALAFFAKYNKAKSAYPVIAEQLQLAQDQFAYLQEVELALERAHKLGELAEIRAELEEEGYLRPGTAKPKREASVMQPSRPLEFTTLDGHQVLVGKNNRQNDFLTLKAARPDDIWLHAQKIPGSHVILRLAGHEEPSPGSLLEAATLAAYYSRGRQSSKVAVDYTRVKHVWKPKNASPGMVLYENQKTILVTPGGEVLERLLGQLSR